MAIEIIQISRPLGLLGVEDTATPEMKTCIMDLTNRLTIALDTLTNEIRSQVVVDQSILPEITNGEAAAGTKITQTNIEVEQAIILASMLDG